MPRKSSDNAINFTGFRAKADIKQKNAYDEADVGFVEDADKKDVNAIEQQDNIPVDNVTQEADPINNTEQNKHISAQERARYEMNQEYTDVNKITICLVQQYSLYRRANDKVLPKRSDYIGSSVNSSRILSANKEEVEAYFPNIIGLSPNNPDFVLRVKQYLNNIRIPVDELGKVFDISFHYYKKSDYCKVQDEMRVIETMFQQANRKDLSSLRKALSEKITRMNALESTKHKYGYPINVDDYLMYRHCLLYPDVAKDMALINSDSRIRFYIKDERKEQERMQKLRMEVNKAKMNYVSCLTDNELFDAIFVQYCVMNNLPLANLLMEDRLQKEIRIDDFSRKEPIKFNKLFTNKDIKLMANIERLIARGKLVRQQHNQNINTVDGEFIGANMTEAVAWFKNPDNTSIVNAYFNELKLS